MLRRTEKACLCSAHVASYRRIRACFPHAASAKNYTMNANYKTLVPRLSMNVLVLLGTAVSGCTQEDSRVRSEPASASAPSEPLVIAPSLDQATVQAPQRKFQVKAGELSSLYVPEFQNGQLIGITEERASPRGTAQASYEFQGARLLRYSGGAFEAEGQLALEFDLQGTVISASVDSQPASQQEIGQARAHAQLLRSHALAQEASHAHSFSSH